MLEAHVLYSSKNIYTVADSHGRKRLCRLRGKRLQETVSSHNPLAPGDRVYLTPNKEDEGLIETRLPRKNALQRCNKRGKAQVIAANIDQAVIVSSLKDPYPHAELISRLLLLAQVAEIPVSLVFNKIDLLNEEELFFAYRQWKKEFAQVGVQIFFISVKDENRKRDWQRFVQSCCQKTVAIIGVSGVGKSSLINRLLNRSEQSTAEISLRWQRGRHTTTRATMIWDEKMNLIDTPGMYSIIPWIDDKRLDHYFPEFSPHLQACYFSSCKHLNEPNCGIKEALAFGSISPSRYRCYCNLLETTQQSLKA